MTARLDPSALIDAARALDGSHAEVAAFLRGMAARDGNDRARIIRRAALRRIRVKRHQWQARTAAARLIAAEWQAVSRGFPVPEEVAEAYAPLAGMRPLAWRAIADDLDDELG